MTYNSARKWLVLSSLVMLGLYGFFLIIAPVTSYPLEYEQALQLLQVLFPLFIGYLSAAVVFVFQGDDITSNLEVSPLLGSLVKGPFLLVFLLIATVFCAFGISNWPSESAGIGEGMPFDMLSTITSLILAIHTGTTSSLVFYLFKSEQK